MKKEEKDTNIISMLDRGIQIIEDVYKRQDLS